MGFFNNPLPGYLRGKNQLIYTVTFTALFSIVFLLVSLPFSHNSWMALGNSRFFVFTVLFALGSLMIVILSKFIMYKTRNKIKMNFLGYITWCVCEVLVICLAYSFITVPITGIGWDQFPKTLGNALLYGNTSLIIPYILAGMYYAIQDKNQIIRLMNYGNVVSDEAVPISQLEKITLFDNSGDLKLCVSASNLYYIESDDNYIVVWYTDSKGDLKRYMLRCRLKTVEESFRGSSLVRCHRKYIVNMDKVKVLRKEKDGYELLFAEFVQCEFDEGAHLRLVVRVAALEVAVGDGAADCAGLVSEVPCHSGDSRALHLEIRDSVVAEAERLEVLQHVRHRKTLSDDSALRPVKS